jgi:hypothetical protein
MNAAGYEGPRAMVIVTINALPAVPTITANGPTSFCTGSSVDLSSSASTGNLWSTGLTTQTISVNATGNYSVTVTDVNGCAASSAPIAVNVSNAPAPSISATSTQACSGDVVTVTSSAADSYLWSSGETTQSIQVSATSTVSVTTTNANACNGVGLSNSITVNFTTSPIAVATYSTSGNVVSFTNSSSNATTYAWDFGDFSNSSAASPTHAFAANGNYTVVLTAINGNCTDTLSFNVAIEVGLTSLNTLSFAVFPNPASELVQVQFEAQEQTTIEVIDALGRVLSVKEINETGLTLTSIETTMLASGTYTIRVRNESSTGVQKLIIRK